MFDLAAVTLAYAARTKADVLGCSQCQARASAVRRGEPLQFAEIVSYSTSHLAKTAEQIRPDEQCSSPKHLPPRPTDSNGGIWRRVSS